MSTTSALMTVEEFRKLKDPPGFYLELHHGEVVQMGFPKSKHRRLQKRVTEIFIRINGKYGVAEYEFIFRPKPEHEVWAADVAFVTQQRYDAMDPEDNLVGSPEIVVEVLSPSNTFSEILDRKTMCLETGCQEFWVIDEKRKKIEITRTDGHSTVYRPGDTILVLPGNVEVTVDEIFG
jgi:Uma2 family endonuclease